MPQFGRDEITELQNMNQRVVDTVLGVEKQQIEDTAGPLDSKQLTKSQRVAKARAELSNPEGLAMWHDQLAQKDGLTPERPISRKWVKAVIDMTKELRDA